MCRITSILKMLVCYLAMACMPAFADMHSCVVNGKRLVSDRPIPECSKVAVKVMNNNGVLKKEIAAPPTTTDLQKLEELKKQQIQRELELEQIKRDERYFQAHYRSESEIRDAQKKTITQLQEKKKLVKEQLNEIDDEMTALDEKIQNAKGKKNISEYEVRVWEIRKRDLQKIIQNKNEAIQILEKEIKRSNQEYEDLVVRYKRVQDYWAKEKITTSKQ